MQLLQSKKSLHKGKNTVIRLLYISPRSIYHYNSLILPLPTEKPLLQKRKYMQQHGIHRKDPLIVFCCRTELGSPCPVSGSLNSRPHHAPNTSERASVANRPLTIDWSGRGDHNLEVPLRAVYWGFLSHKWPPGTLLPFSPCPHSEEQQLHKDASEHLEGQEFFRLWWWNGQVQVKASMKSDSCSDYHSSEKYSNGYKVTHMHSLHF